MLEESLMIVLKIQEELELEFVDTIVIKDIKKF